MKKTIALDADGVILNFLHQWEISCLEKLGRKVSRVSPDYVLCERYDISRNEMLMVWEHFNAAGHWKKIPGIKGSAQAVHDLLYLGFDVQVITAINPIILPDRQSNFMSIGLPSNLPIHCVGNGKKLETLTDLNAICFVDDHTFHLEEAKEAGVPVRILINDDTNSTCADATHCMRSLEEFAQMVKSGRLLQLPKRFQGMTM